MTSCYDGIIITPSFSGITNINPVPSVSGASNFAVSYYVYKSLFIYFTILLAFNLKKLTGTLTVSSTSYAVTAWSYVSSDQVSYCGTTQSITNIIAAFGLTNLAGATWNVAITCCSTNNSNSASSNKIAKAAIFLVSLSAVISSYLAWSTLFYN